MMSIRYRGVYRLYTKLDHKTIKKERSRTVAPNIPRRPTTHLDVVVPRLPDEADQGVRSSRLLDCSRIYSNFQIRPLNTT